MTTSETVYTQYDYIQTIEWINKINNKPNKSFGSVILGKKYATFYSEKINEMLISKYINIQILEELKTKIKEDFEIIINDCNKRIQHQDVLDNKYMISIILDFIFTYRRRLN